jgi:hypothetical protein
MYEIGNLEMEDLLFKQLHNVSGYVTRDDIITIRSHKNNLSHLFGISMGCLGRRMFSISFNLNPE